MKDIKMIFSVNLKKWLVDRDKNQADVSRYLGVSSATVSDWCSAKKIPRMDKIQSLANWLGLEVSDLLEEKNTDRITAELSNYEEQLLDKFRALPANRQHDVERIINMYYEEVSQ